LFKLRIDHPVGKSFTTDSDAFQHTVASQLMQHQVGFNQTCTTTADYPIQVTFTRCALPSANLVWYFSNSQPYDSCTAESRSESD